MVFDSSIFRTCMQFRPMYCGRSCSMTLGRLKIIAFCNIISTLGLMKNMNGNHQILANNIHIDVDSICTMYFRYHRVCGWFFLLLCKWAYSYFICEKAIDQNQICWWCIVDETGIVFILLWQIDRNKNKQKKPRNLHSSVYGMNA